VDKTDERKPSKGIVRWESAVQEVEGIGKDKSTRRKRLVGCSLMDQ